MSDLIEREAALCPKITLPMKLNRKTVKIVTEVLNGYGEYIAGLPSAQPERKEGQWIRKSDWMWTCPFCGKDNAYAYSADDAYEPTVLQDFFCPNCGARMGGNGNADK